MPSPVIDEMLAANTAYAAHFADGDMPAAPARGLAVVTCMDARLDLHAALGLPIGAAHVLRNAGGIVTDDTIRSLALSQRALGTDTIVVIHHTRCGVHGLDDAAFLDDLEADSGERATWSPGGFDDPYADVARSLQLLEDSPFIAGGTTMAGFVFDVEQGRLLPVT